jgi:hypothetical protein
MLAWRMANAPQQIVAMGTLIEPFLRQFDPVDPKRRTGRRHTHPINLLKIHVFMVRAGFVFH